ELAVVALLFAATTIALTIYSFGVTYTKHIDSVFLFEGLKSIHTTGVPLSETVGPLPKMLLLLESKAEEYCASPLTAVNEPYRILDNHAYLLMYLLALPAYFV